MPLSNKETFPCRPPWSLARIKSQSRTEGRKTPSGKYLSTFSRKKNKGDFLCFTPPENEFGHQTSFQVVQARTSPYESKSSHGVELFDIPLSQNPFSSNLTPMASNFVIKFCCVPRYFLSLR